MKIKRSGFFLVNKEGKFARNICESDIEAIRHDRPILTDNIKESLKPRDDFESAMCSYLTVIGFQVKYLEWDDEIEINIENKQSCSTKFVLKFVGKFSYIGMGNKFALFEKTTNLFNAVHYPDQDTAEQIRKISYGHIYDELEVKEVHALI